MLFSIIVPIYKVESYLNQCVDSILSQTFQDFEIVLVDDGSPDACPSICDEYAKKDPRIKVVHKENGGLSDARNAGIAVASGEYFIFIDSDDYWDNSEALGEIQKLIVLNCPDMITWRFKKYLEDRDEIVRVGQSIEKNKQDDFAELIRTRNFTVSSCNKAIKKALFDEYELKFVKGMYSEDIEWCARLLSVVKTIIPSNLDFYVYRQRSGSITHEIGKQNIHDVRSHILFIESLAQDEKCSNKDKMRILLAEEFCNFIVTLTAYKDYKEEINFIKEKKHLLKWASSKKSKILKWLITFIGIKLTIKLIGLAR